MKHTIKLLTLVFMLAAILTLTGCPGPVNTIEPPVWDDGVVTTEPTCTTEGVKTYTCSNGETRTETIPALGHDMGDKWEITKNPTCTEKGSKTRKCSHCGETETVEIDALGHDWEEIITDKTKVATCTENGIAVYKCKTCGAIEERTVSKLGHNFGEWTVTTEETCTTDGTKKRVCSRCGHEETEIIFTHHTFIAGGCDKCGAYEHNKEDDYQIKAYVYSSVEDAKKGENERVLYFSFPNDTTGIPQIVTINAGLAINLDDLIQMKNKYIGNTVKYVGFEQNDFPIQIDTCKYMKDPYPLTDLENNGRQIYIVIE